MKLESQLHLGYCMGIYTSDAEAHLNCFQQKKMPGLVLHLALSLSLSEEVHDL